MSELHSMGPRMDRRSFLRRAGGAAIVTPTLAAILAACGKPGVSGASSPASGSTVADLLANPARPDNPVTLPLWQDPIATNTPIEMNATLSIYNWTDYLWPKLYKEFEDQYSKYGVKVQLTTFNDIDEGIQKISS